MAIERAELNPLLQDDEQENEIDTLSILKRLEIQKKFPPLDKKFKDYKTSTIDFSEKCKDYIPLGSSLAIVTGMGAYAIFLANFFRLPTLKEVFALNRGDLLNYANTVIKTLNNTCGNLIPIKENICKNIFQSEAARFCERYTYYYQFAVSRIDNYLKYCSAFPLTNYCEWPKLGDLAYNCAVRLNQYSIEHCSDSSVGGPAGFYINYDELKKICGYMPSKDFCSTPVNTSKIILCGENALSACNAMIRDIIRFNVTIPGHSYTCTSKFYSSEVYHVCSNASPCQNYNGNDDDWWSTFRIGLLVGLSLALLAQIALAIFALLKGKHWTQGQNKLSRLNLDKEEEDNFEEILTLYNIESDIKRTDMTFTQAMSLMDKAGCKIENDKQTINDYRHGFLLGRNDADSTIPSDLPNDMVVKILHHAGLFAKPLVEMTAVECEEKTLMNFQGKISFNH